MTTRRAANLPPGPPWRTAVPAVQRAQADFGARLSAALPAHAAGQWCVIALGLADPAPWWAKLELTDIARGQIVREVFLGPARRRGGRLWRSTLVHVPSAAETAAVAVFGAAAHDAVLHVSVLSRAAAAATLLRSGWRLLPAALRGEIPGMAGRIRAMLGQGPARAGEAPPYADWIRLFETAPDASMLAAAEAWRAQVAIVAGAPAPTAASADAAAAVLPHGLPVRIIRAAEDWRSLDAAWVILLQAGEILSRDAAAAFAAAAQACPWADVLTADCDALDRHGVRHTPLFKPGPDPILLASGLPVRGACALRWRNVPLTLPLHGHAARLALALRSPGTIAHVPRILSHVRWDCEIADTVARPPGISGQSPGEAAAHARHQALDMHLPDAPASARHAFDKHVLDTLAQRLPAPDRATRRAPVAHCAPVTIVMPSAARSRHVVSCIRRLLQRTQDVNFSVKLVLSAPGSENILRDVSGLPQVSILKAFNQPFNYARANNAGAASVTTELMLLMNDDLAPLRPDWLARMAEYMRDPSVGIVGARLLYGNGMVQHEGVIMGLANLCEHAGRLRPGSDPGLHGIGRLDRQVSAVTAACLLIRTSLYRQLGGMDEAFAVALNDVDLCLRARRAGWRVVYCANSLLYHYESLSLGRHYAGGRAALEGIEVRRLRERFAPEIAADPFYTPSASLQPGREWHPAFPPRTLPKAVGISPSGVNLAGVN